MTTIEVLLQVPEHIEIGLASGVYERVGGIIRETAGRKIVAWLRDGIDMNTHQPVTMASQALSSLSISGQLLNLGVSSASMLIILDRIKKLSTEVERLGQSLEAEFQRQRETRITGALERARDALEATDQDTRKQLAHIAIGKLKDSENELLDDTRQAIIENRLDSAQYSFLQAMYALTSRIRCFLEMEDLKLARNRLVEQLPKFEECARNLIAGWLGDHPAIFLHSTISDEDVYRFISIMEWVNGEPFVKIVVENLRHDFWKDELTRDQNIDIFSRIRRDTPQIFADKMKAIPNILTQIETLLENYERLLGFELEIRSMRLIDGSFQKWRERYPEENGFAVLCPDSPLDLENSQ